MHRVKIATWNVNSLRVRLPHVLAWLAENEPDVLVLQEIKMLEENFPFAEFEKVGYLALVSGQKTYNGVAILTRSPYVDPLTDLPNFVDPQRRLLAATINGIRIVCVYIPNGESVGSEKYQYKLTWLNHFNEFLKAQLLTFPNMLILGDFNIAPENSDVYDPKQWEGHVLFSDAERAAFQSILQLGFVDCFRMHSPHEKEFTWWDYRLNAFKRNMGLRIDHILASQACAVSCLQCYIDKTPRTWERPSDHVPVVAEFQIK